MLTGSICERAQGELTEKRAFRADGVTECVMTLLLQSLWLISGEYIWRKPKFKRVHAPI